ncbi:MAG: glycosyltransferase family 2 protein [Candidatus Bathyarchaeia archaeon]
MLKIGPPVTVIILNYNGASYVKRCLGSVLWNSYPNFEVLFIDNNSTDGSANLAEKLFGSNPRLTIIRNAKNLGFSVGNNIGFERSKAKYVIVLNNDTEVQKNFIETLVRVAESDESIGSVGCKIVQSDGSVRYGPKYMAYGLIVHARQRQTYEKFTVNLANCGCAALYRKSVIDKIGGFDPLFWADWEDHDLGYRINLAGYKSVYTPETMVLHLGGGLTLGLSKERKVRIFRNRLLTYLKNYETKNLLLRFPILFSLAVLREALLVIKNREMFPILKGILEFFKAIKPVLKERRRIQKLRKVSDKQIFRNTKIPEYLSVVEAMKLS